MASSAKNSAGALLRVGVVGVGVMGSNHARVLADLPAVRLVGVADPDEKQRAFVCAALGTVKLSGEIIPGQFIQDGKAQVHVSYMAAWASRMFAMLDSFTTEFDIGTAPVARDGTFQMDLPDFYADSAIPSSRDSASFRLTLLGLNSGNVISVNLEPQATDLQMPTGHLPILPSYPGRLLFTATPAQSPGSQTGSSGEMPK